MSRLMLGMGKRAFAEATPDSGLTIREQILRHLITALLGVRKLSQPIAAKANATPGVRSASSGAYLGTVVRRYRCTVVLTGVSGAAKITVTDITGGSDPIDNGPVLLAITSGTAFDIGALGVQLTLTWSGTLRLGDYWDIYAGPYHCDVLAVSRQETQYSEQPAGVYGRLLEPVEQMDDQPVGMTTKIMQVSIAMQIYGLADPQSALELVLGDCEKAVLADHTRGGLAIDTTPQTNDAYARDEVAAYSGFTLLFEVLYRHRRGDPYTQ